MKKIKLAVSGLVMIISLTACASGNKEARTQINLNNSANPVNTQFEYSAQEDVEETKLTEEPTEQTEETSKLTEEATESSETTVEPTTGKPSEEELAVAEQFIEEKTEEVAEEPAPEELIAEPTNEEPSVEETVTEESAPVPELEELPEVVYSVTGMDGVMHATKACKIYVEPSTDYEQIGSLVAEQAIRVTGITDNGWYQVEFCGKTGYITIDLLKEQEVTPEPEQEPTLAQATGYNMTSVDMVMFSTCDSLIFNAPDTASGVMGSLVRDQAIRVTGQTDTGWYQVEFCGQPGYMTMDMLTATARIKERSEYTEAELIQMCLAECVTPGMSDWDKAIAINNYLVDFCEYDYSYSHRSTYDALTHGQVVCQGYANAYKKLMEAAGVKTDYISGQGWTGREWGSHGWNRVTIDGQYYYVDVTWNDSMRGNYYLLLDYDTFHYDHYQQRVNPYRVE